MSREVLYGLFALLLLLPGVFGRQDVGAVRALLRNRAVQLLGLVSYAIYLWHTAAIDEFHKRTHTVPFSGHVAPLLGFVLLTTIVVAAVSYVIVERPALSLKGRA
jgi:peptidoglycan/LPS O-acetylase OafA/YrhL